MHHYSAYFLEYMKRTCIKDFKYDNMLFITGVDYEVNWNPIIQKLILYDVFGNYTIIDKSILNKYFL